MLDLDLDIDQFLPSKVALEQHGTRILMYTLTYALMNFMLVETQSRN
jgi:hypothetical protein